jgi:hypothetical protein
MRAICCYRRRLCTTSEVRRVPTSDDEDAGDLVIWHYRFLLSRTVWHCGPCFSGRAGSMANGPVRPVLRSHAWYMGRARSSSRLACFVFLFFSFFLRKTLFHTSLISF